LSQPHKSRYPFILLHLQWGPQAKE
jgi:hypothetical protein